MRDLEATADDREQGSTPTASAMGTMQKFSTQSFLKRPEAGESPALPTDRECSSVAEHGTLKPSVAGASPATPSNLNLWALTIVQRFGILVSCNVKSVMAFMVVVTAVVAFVLRYAQEDGQLLRSVKR